MFYTNIYKRLLLLTIAVVAFFSACRTDFDINAEWQDLTVVYGLLDLGDDVHYLKINRAFLGDGNALIMAAVADSVNYKTKLEVHIDEYRNGAYTGRRITFDTLTLYGKPEGIFSAPAQLVYATDTSASTILGGDCIYKLFIKNPENGKEITAETPIVNDVTILRPRPTQPFMTFINRIPADIKWRTTYYGRLYQLIIRFHYKETDAFNNSKFYSLDWDLGTLRSTNIGGGEEIGTTYLGEQFFKTISAHLKPNPDVKRYPVNVEMIIAVAGDDLATYIDVNKPSGGIIQEKPEYSNISNGIGIFSSRLTKRHPYKLSSPSIDTLVSGRHTGHLGFNRPDPSTP